MSSLLGRNAVPSTGEAREIRSSLRCCHAEIVAVDADIVRTWDKFQELRQRREVLKKHVDQLDALVSPARRLYPELVAAIFTHCLTHDTELPDPYPHKIRVSPLSLSQICSGWRGVALSTPQLWSSIPITFDPSLMNAVEIIQRRVRMLHSWLERSGSLPITADIRRCDKSWASSSEWQTEGRQLVAELLPYSQQWTDLTFHLPNSCLSPLWEAMGTPLPQLTRLTVVDEDPAGRWRIFSGRGWSVPAIKHVAEIQHLSLTLPLLNLRSYDIRWCQLSSLSLMAGYSHNQSLLNLDSAASVLRECTNVVTCHLSIGGGGTFHAAPVVTPRLKNLDLVISGVGLRDLLRVLSAPQLEELRINEGWNVAAVASFLAGLHRPLRCFSIRRIYGISGEELLQCLQQAPSLVSLSISSCVSDEVIHALTSSDANTIYHLCPRLTSLDIRVPDDCDETQLGNMIESRCVINSDNAGVSTLKSVHVDFQSRELPSETLTCCFDHLKANGLVITYNQVDRWDWDSEFGW